MHGSVRRQFSCNLSEPTKHAVLRKALALYGGQGRVIMGGDFNIKDHQAVQQIVSEDVHGMWALQFNHTKADDIIICRGFTRALPTGRLKSFADYLRKPHYPVWCDMIAKPLQTSLVNAFPELLPPLPPLVSPSMPPMPSMPTRQPPIPGLGAHRK